MNYQEFTTQLDRLKRHFGDKGFSPEMAHLVYKEWAPHPQSMFKRIVEYFILEKRKTPTGGDFTSALRLELTKQEKRDYRQGAETINSQEMGVPEEIRYKTGMIQRRLAGKVSDAEWNEFMGALKAAADLEDSGGICERCHGYGTVAARKDNMDWAFSCSCIRGKGFPNYPQWHNRLYDSYQVI